jgi:hypothetical protein
MSAQYKAFFKRSALDVGGLFTIKKIENGAESVVFSRLEANSGQKGYTDGSKDWVRSRGPIPTGKYKIHLYPINPGLDAGHAGIGESWPISNVPGNPDLIRNPKNPAQVRELVRVHGENDFRGTLACIGIAKKPEWRQISAFFKSLAAQGYKTLDLEVFF